MVKPFSHITPSSHIPYLLLNQSKKQSRAKENLLAHEKAKAKKKIH